MNVSLEMAALYVLYKYNNCFVIAIYICIYSYMRVYVSVCVYACLYKYLIILYGGGVLSIYISGL